MATSRVYEFTVVYPVDESKDKLIKQVTALAKKAKVEIVKQDDWGQKRLAHSLKKHTEGYYIHSVISGEVEALKILVKGLNHERGILRYLLVAA